MSEELITLSDAAAELGVSRPTISDVVRLNGIITKPIKYAHRGRGLSRADMEIIRRVLKRRRNPQPSPAA